MEKNFNLFDLLQSYNEVELNLEEDDANQKAIHILPISIQMFLK